MTPEKVIELAKQAGMTIVDDEFSMYPFLQRFAELVGNAKLEEAAKMCLEISKEFSNPEDAAERFTCQWCEKEIRSLKK